MAKLKPNEQPHLAVVPPKAPETTKPDPDVVLNLSLNDRWFAAVTLQTSPWGGGEANVLALNTIYETLKLKEVPLDKTAGVLSRSAKNYTMKASLVERLLHLLCGGAGNAYQGHAGPMLAQVVIRMRAQVKKALAAAEQDQKKVSS